MPYLLQTFVKLGIQYVPAVDTETENVHVKGPSAFSGSIHLYVTVVTPMGNAKPGAWDRQVRRTMLLLSTATGSSQNPFAVLPGLTTVRRISFGQLTVGWLLSFCTRKKEEM